MQQYMTGVLFFNCSLRCRKDLVQKVSNLGWQVQECQSKMLLSWELKHLSILTSLSIVNSWGGEKVKKTEALKSCCMSLARHAVRVKSHWCNYQQVVEWDCGWCRDVNAGYLTQKKQKVWTLQLLRLLLSSLYKILAAIPSQNTVHLNFGSVNRQKCSTKPQLPRQRKREICLWKGWTRFISATSITTPNIFLLVHFTAKQSLHLLRRFNVWMSLAVHFQAILM